MTFCPLLGMITNRDLLWRKRVMTKRGGEVSWVSVCVLTPFSPHLLPVCPSPWPLSPPCSRALHAELFRPVLLLAFTRGFLEQSMTCVCVCKYWSSLGATGLALCPYKETLNNILWEKQKPRDSFLNSPRWKENKWFIMLTVISTLNLITGFFLFNLFCGVYARAFECECACACSCVCVSVCILETICGDLWTGLVGGYKQRGKGMSREGREKYLHWLLSSYCSERVHWLDSAKLSWAESQRVG